MSKPSKSTAKNSGNIYIGIGGWTFEPWRGVFYPEGLTQAKELAYAASKLTSIEINGTYYGSQKPESFRKWAREVPDGFVFSVKGPRFATNRRVLAEAGEFDQALLRFRRDWNWATGSARCCGSSRRPKNSTRPISASSSNCCRASSRAARCATWSRCGMTASACPSSSRLLRKFETPVVFAEHGKYPAIADVVGDFVYARLQKGNDELKTCYPPKAARRLGQAVSGLGRRRRARRSAARRHAPSRRRCRATCSPTSSTRARCARRPARWS